MFLYLAFLTFMCIIKAEGHSIAVNVGEDVTLPCAVSSESPVTWYIHNISNPDNRVVLYVPWDGGTYTYLKHLISTNSKDPQRATIDLKTGDLTIHSVRLQPQTDQYEYICQSGGSTSSVLLTIHEEKIIEACEGNDVVLPCQTHAASGYTWYINDKTKDNVVVQKLPWENNYKYYRNLNDSGETRAIIDESKGDLIIKSVRRKPLTDQHVYICEGTRETKKVYLAICDGEVVTGEVSTSRSSLAIFEVFDVEAESSSSGEDLEYSTPTASKIHVSTLPVTTTKNLGQTGSLFLYGGVAVSLFAALLMIIIISVWCCKSQRRKSSAEKNPAYSMSSLMIQRHSVNAYDHIYEAINETTQKKGKISCNTISNKVNPNAGCSLESAYITQPQKCQDKQAQVPVKYGKTNKRQVGKTVDDFGYEIPRPTI